MTPKRKPPARHKPARSLTLPPDLVAALEDRAAREEITPAELIAGSVFGARTNGAYSTDTLDQNRDAAGWLYLERAANRGNRAAWWLLNSLPPEGEEAALGVPAVELAARCPDAAALLEFLPGPVRDELLDLPAPWPARVRDTFPRWLQKPGAAA